MTETVFQQADQATQETPVVSQQAPTPTIPTELAELVGAGKKYQTVDEALRSVPHAQKHISTLEQELADARAELQKRQTAEDLLADIKQGVIQQGTTPPKVDLSREVVSEIVHNALSQEKQKEQAKTNISIVTSNFEKAYGEKAEATYIKLSEESGLTIEQLNQLAITSPEAVLRLAGLKNSSLPPRPIQGNVNTLSLAGTNTTPELSARVKKGATSKDVQAAWEIAKQKVLKQNS